MSLFAGIGGFDLAARWMGWESKVMVELDPFCQKVLYKNFPEAEIHGDIKQFDGTPYMGAIDLICGGFPCQPYSSAGKRLGKEDDRHLWPQMRKVVRQVAPRWVVGENVRGILTWDEGLVVKEVLTDLADAGYTPLPPFLLPASGIGANHERYRTWFVAYSQQVEREWREWSQQGYSETGQPNCSDKPNVGQCVRCQAQPGSVLHGRQSDVANARSQQFDLSIQSTQGRKQGQGLDTHWQDQRQSHDANPDQSGRQKQYTPAQLGWAGYGSGEACGWWDEWTTEPPILRVDDGLPYRLDPSTRNNRIGALGNAVVPQVVYQLFQAIQHIESQLQI